MSAKRIRDLAVAFASNRLSTIVTCRGHVTARVSGQFRSNETVVSIAKA